MQSLRIRAICSFHQLIYTGLSLLHLNISRICERAYKLTWSLLRTSLDFKSFLTSVKYIFINYIYNNNKMRINVHQFPCYPFLLIGTIKSYVYNWRLSKCTSNSANCSSRIIALAFVFRRPHSFFQALKFPVNDDVFYENVDEVWVKCTSTTKSSNIDPN